MVIGYLHKVLPTSVRSMSPKDLLFSCITHKIPVLLVVPKPEQEATRKVLGDAKDYVRLVEPADLYQSILKVIS